MAFQTNHFYTFGKSIFEEPYKANKDSGYNIFYMGINIGAFICNIIAAFMRNKFGWGEAFITAGGCCLGWSFLRLAENITSTRHR
jgi:dipeptide/tripeptide permease